MNTINVYANTITTCFSIVTFYSRFSILDTECIFFIYFFSAGKFREFGLSNYSSWQVVSENPYCVTV